MAKSRYFFLSLFALGYFVNFLDRGAIAVAIPFIGKELALSKTDMGLVMSAFFLGFVLLQLPAGSLADRLGTRYLISLGLAWWSAFTILTGAAGSFLGMIITRFLFGVGEGVYPPASLKALSVLMPIRERAKANGILLAANSLAFAVVPVLGALIIRAWGWRYLFVIIGIPGFIIAGAIAIFYRKLPGAEPPRVADGPKASVAQLVRLPVIWILAAGWFSFFLAYWGLTSWLPTYLYESRHLSVMSMGLAASLPNVFGIVGMLVGGVLSDIVSRGHRRRTIIPALVVGALAIGAGYFMRSFWTMEILFSIGFFAHSMVPSAYYSIPMDILPEELVGAGLGLVNGVGMISGVVAPALMGYFLDLTRSYLAGFTMIVGALLLAAALLFLVREKPVTIGLRATDGWLDQARSSS